MTPQELRDRLRHTPFEPFRLVTTRGTFYDVRNPEMMMVGTGSVTVGIPAPEDVSLYQSSITVSLFHVHHIEPIPAVPQGGNGQQQG
jgi:hypothetical protein